jgi:lipoprotein-anchoring transpeptidase ErfK/SrfK
MVRVSGLCASVVSGRFWCVAALTTAGAIDATPSAEAALYSWQDAEPGFSQFSPFPYHSYHARRQKARQHSGKKDTVEKETAGKPQGPLVIAVSINKQQLKIYDTNGFFAQSPVSSGMAGHSTPMGVFSVIQKHKFHHSNIYSNAPMPYMQRITWSGVALHAGVLPGYPASHGCIRMPTSFAIKMWNWTRMGARVIVTPGETAPVPISHPLLPTFKVAPQPAVAEQPAIDAPAAAKADKGAQSKPTEATAGLELRSTVGQNNAATPAADVAQMTLRDQTHTADAADAKVTMSDALSRNNAAAADSGKSDTTNAADVAKTGAAENAKPGDTKFNNTKPDDTKTATADHPPASTRQAANTTSDQGASDGKKDQSKDQSRLTRPEAPKRTGQIAVFISRKDSKIYVRQNFAPLFQAPVTIAASDRPLGTHVFTAEVDKTDANALQWSVISLPVSVRSAMRNDNSEYGARRRKNAGAIDEAKPLPTPDSATEALDRISVPGDTMARIAEALTSGGSIIVSDQGINQGETGEGTDFIVSLR